MYIKNLNQLKKNLKVGMTFEIIEYLYRPECVGEKRTVTKIQSNGFWSKAEGNTDTGKGYGSEYGRWCDFGKASEWKFGSYSMTKGYCELIGTMTFAYSMIEEENTNENG